MEIELASPSIAELQHKAAMLAARAEQLETDDTVTTDLVRPNAPLGVTPAQGMKDTAAAKVVELRSIRRELEATTKQMRDVMEAEVRRMQAMMAPMLEKARQLEEVVHTANLYLGVDETIERLRGGEPAPADTPITIRQMVLSMDEECAMNVDGGGEQGGIDHMDVDRFDAWLLESEDHLNQVLPEQRGVVCLVPRRRGKDYMDPWANEVRNKENQHTYWLLRNGAQLSRMDTAFDVGTNLVPKQDEFTGLFRKQKYNHTTRQNETVDLVPGSREWMDAEKAQGARQRHFMKVALILQGLIDRTNHFEPLAGPVSFLHPESYENGRAVMLADGERSLTSNRKPFYTWLRELNEQLRPGMRIIGSFGHTDFTHDTYDDWRGSRYNRRITPRTASRPQSKVIHQIDRVEKGRFVFKYDRNDMVWNSHGEYVEAANRASAWVKVSDRFVLPIDLADVATMREYLGARTERHAYLDMFAVLKTAIAIKEKEAAQEAPFISYLAGTVAADLQITTAEAEEAVREVVAWWKLGNKWNRPLVKGEDPAAEAKAAKAIIREVTARHRGQKNDQPAVDATVLSQLKSKPGTLLYLGRRTNGAFLAFFAQPLKYGKDTGLPQNVWTTEVSLSKTGKISGTREWILPGTRHAKLTTVFASAAWKDWEISTNYRDFLTDGEIDELVAELERRAIQQTTVDGWTPYRYGAVRTVDPDATIFGVAYGRDEKVFRAYIQSPAYAAKEATEAIDKDRTCHHLVAAAKWTKTAPGQVDLEASSEGGIWVRSENRWHNDGFKDRDEFSRPWGRETDTDKPLALRQYPAELAKMQELLHEADLHNAARSALLDRSRDYLRNLQEQTRKREEDNARERYMLDYKDPEGWEEQRSKKHFKGVELTGNYWAPKHPAAHAIHRLVTDGAILDGQTVADIMAAAGSTADEIERAREDGLLELVVAA